MGHLEGIAHGSLSRTGWWNEGTLLLLSGGASFGNCTKNGITNLVDLAPCGLGELTVVGMGCAHHTNIFKHSVHVLLRDAGDDRLVQFRWQYYDPTTEKVTDGKLASVPESGEPCHTQPATSMAVFSLEIP